MTTPSSRTFSSVRIDPAMRVAEEIVRVETVRDLFVRFRIDQDGAEYGPLSLEIMRHRPFRDTGCCVRCCCGCARFCYVFAGAWFGVRLSDGAIV
jgi:hypothetical protein